MLCVNMGQPLQCVNMISDVRVVVFCLFLILIRHPFDQTRLTNSGEKISRAEKEKRPFFMGYMWWSQNLSSDVSGEEDRYIRSQSHSCAIIFYRGRRMLLSDIQKMQMY